MDCRITQTCSTFTTKIMVSEVFFSISYNGLQARLCICNSKKQRPGFVLVWMCSLLVFGLSRQDHRDLYALAVHDIIVLSTRCNLMRTYFNHIIFEGIHGDGYIYNKYGAMVASYKIIPWYFELIVKLRLYVILVNCFVV